MSKEAMKLALEALEVATTPLAKDRQEVLRAQAALREALKDQPAPVQQGGLEIVDDEGENQAVRMFLALYGGACGVTAEQMRKHLKMAGFDGAWPEWANSRNGHLTKAGAQLWIRHLFALAEQPAQQEPVAIEYWLQDTMELGRWVTTDNMAKATAEKMLSGEYGDVYPQGRIVEPSPQPTQQQEPVAWGNFKEDGTLVGLSQHPEDQANWTGRKPLYTFPPASKPLTDEEFISMVDSTGLVIDPELAFEIKALVEAAHGIKEDT